MLGYECICLTEFKNIYISLISVGLKTKDFSI